jgi:hypothetical protein
MSDNSINLKNSIIELKKNLNNLKEKLYNAIIGKGVTITNDINKLSNYPSFIESIPQNLVGVDLNDASELYENNLMSGLKAYGSNGLVIGTMESLSRCDGRCFCTI